MHLNADITEADSLLIDKHRREEGLERPAAIAKWLRCIFWLKDTKPEIYCDYNIEVANHKKAEFTRREV